MSSIPMMIGPLLRRLNDMPTIIKQCVGFISKTVSTKFHFYSIAAP